MQLQLREGEAKNKAHRLNTNSFSETLRVENADGEQRASILHVNAIEASFADHSSGVLDHPRKSVLRQMLYHRFGRFSCHGPIRVVTTAEHFVDFWIAFEPEEAFDIFGSDLPKNRIGARQSRKYIVLHAANLDANMGNVWRIFAAVTDKYLSLRAQITITSPLGCYNILLGRFRHPLKPTAAAAYEPIGPVLRRVLLNPAQ